MATRPRKKQAVRKGTTSQPQQPQPSYNSYMFRSLGCAKFFGEIEARPKFVKERAIMLTPGEFEDLQQNISNRGWDNLVTYPKKASKALVYEFFSNVFPKQAIDGDLAFPKNTSYVRGHEIPYDSATINELFGIRSVEILDCRLRTKADKERIRNIPERAAEISAVLCKPGTDWVRNKSGQPWKIMTNTLIPIARAWAAFVLTTICPSSNQSELTIDRACLIACIMRGDPINIGYELKEEISSFAKFKDGSQPSYWRHASLVALLCERAGVVAESDEEPLAPSAAINGAWIRTIAGGGHVEQPVHREDSPHEQHQEAEPTFSMNEPWADPYGEDFQHLQGRMDILAANQEQMAARQEQMASEYRFGMRSLYRAMCTMQSGGHLDPDADIFQAPPPDSGCG